MSHTPSQLKALGLASRPAGQQQDYPPKTTVIHAILTTNSDVFDTPTLRSAAFPLLACLALIAPAQANPVLPEVAHTSVLNAGTSKDAFPFAYQNAAGELVGYSVDILNLVRQELERKPAGDTAEYSGPRSG